MALNQIVLKQIITCFALGIAFLASAQLTSPWNPDEDGNQSIGSPDLLSFLTVYGEDFVPEPVQIDSLDLYTFLVGIQSQVESLQNEVDSLTTLLNSNQSPRTYVARAEFNATQTLEAIYFLDPSGEGLYATEGAAATITGNSGMVGSFTFEQESAPPRSILCYAANTANDFYVITHVNAGGDNLSHRLTGIGFSPFESSSDASNQVDAGVFSEFGNAAIEIDLNKANFDWNRIGFPVAEEAHVYLIFTF